MSHGNSTAKKDEVIPESLSDLHCFTETSGVITTTMFDVPGYKVVKVLGTVYGITVRSRNWAAGFGMVLKSVVGGELKWFTSMVSFASSLPSSSFTRPHPIKTPCQSCAPWLEERKTLDTIR